MINQSKQITEGALILAIYVLLLLITLFVPIISFLTVFTLAVPFVFYTARHGWKPSIIVVCAALILSLLFIPLITLPTTIFMTFGGVMIGHGIHRKYSAYETWARGSLGFAVGLFLLYVISQAVFQVDVLASFNHIVDESKEMTRQLFEQFGFTDELDKQLALFDQMKTTVSLLIPFIITVTSIMIAFISQWLSYRVISRFNQQKLRFPAFMHLRMPMSLLWIYFVTIIFTFFPLDQDGTLYLIVINVYGIVNIFMVIQGLSFLFYFAYAKHISKAVPIVIIVISILIPFILMYVIGILGIIDLGFRLRDKIPLNKDDNNKPSK